MFVYLNYRAATDDIAVCTASFVQGSAMAYSLQAFVAATANGETTYTTEAIFRDEWPTVAKHALTDAQHETLQLVFKDALHSEACAY